jgi:hypothetical protein
LMSLFFFVSKAFLHTFRCLMTGRTDLIKHHFFRIMKIKIWGFTFSVLLNFLSNQENVIRYSLLKLYPYLNLQKLSWILVQSCIHWMASLMKVSNGTSQCMHNHFIFCSEVKISYMILEMVLKHAKMDL